MLRRKIRQLDQLSYPTSAADLTISVRDAGSNIAIASAEF
jgi:hypothetical protein